MPCSPEGSCCRRLRWMTERGSPGAGWAVPPSDPPGLELEGSDLQFPVHRIWCVGRNYAAHAREMEPDPARLVHPDPPFFFLKPCTALASGGGSVPYPPNTHLLHHEVELVAAIGRRGWKLDPTAALDHVVGYGVGLDLTRRDRQAEAKQKGRPWSLAKGFDRSAPCSRLVTAAEIGHPAAGRITARVNGELRQDADLSDQIWSVGQVVAALSAELEILPGDLLFTGTPAGVGALEVGDVIVARIEGVGGLEVRIAPPR